MKKLIDKIQGLSVKKKVIIFFSLFVLSFAWVLFRNPVYIDTTAYVFPIEDTGDGRVYWGIKNGYNSSMADPIPEDAYYGHIEDLVGSSIVIENIENNSLVEKIDIKNGINFYDLKGDIVRFERFEGIEEILELPRKEGIRLLIVKNGATTEMYFSSIQVWYRKQLLNRDVAATFPFYLAYTTGGNIAFDKTVPDNKLYDVSFERRQWFADYYLDPAMPHYIAKNFKRSVDFPFGHSKLLFGMSILATLVLTCFLFFIPYNLLKTSIMEGTNRLLFIGLAIYLVVMWLLFRHSLFYSWDTEQIVFAINLDYSTWNNHIYQIAVYVYYLIGYSSRVFFTFFQFCIIIWNYEKILSGCLTSGIRKAVKYVLLIIPMFSPLVILLTANSRREISALLFIILAYMYFFDYHIHNRSSKKMLFAACCLLVGVAYRIDYILFFIPFFLYFLIKKLTFKRIIAAGFLGIGVLVYAFFTGQGANNVPFRRLLNIANNVDYALAKYGSELSEKEKKIMSDAFVDGVDTFANNLSFLSSFDNYKLTDPYLSEIKDVERLMVKTILRHPYEFIKKCLYKFMVIDNNGPGLLNMPYAEGDINRYAQFVADLPHKHNLYKMSNQFMADAHRKIYHNFLNKISLITLLILPIFFFRKMKFLALVNIGFVFYGFIVLVYSPAPPGVYWIVIYYYVFFLFGLIIYEILKTVSIKKKYVISVNILLLVIFIGFTSRSLYIEEHGTSYIDNKGVYEFGTTVYYPYYYRMLPKTVLVYANSSVPKDTMNYLLELETKKGEKQFVNGSFKTFNKSVLETIRIPASTWRAKLTFESNEADALINVKPVIDIRKHIYTILLFLFLYINVGFFKRKIWPDEKKEELIESASQTAPVYEERALDNVRRSVSIIVPYLLKFFPDAKNVVCFGDKSKIWVKEFHLAGLDVLGVEFGNIQQEKSVTGENFINFEAFLEQVKNNRKFDIAISLDIEEYVSAENMNEFLSKLVKSSDIVIFSAAVPGQYDNQSFVEQWPSFWIERFRRHSYKCIDFLRPLFWFDNRIEWRYRQNMLFFVKEGKTISEKINSLTEFYGFPLIHPLLYLSNREWKVFHASNKGRNFFTMIRVFGLKYTLKQSLQRIVGSFK